MRSRIGELTVTAQAADIVAVMTLPARRPALPVQELHRHHRGRLAGPRAALRRRLSSAVAEAERAHPRQGRDRRGDAGALDHRGLSRRRLVRARDLRSLRHRCSPAIPTCGASSPTTASRVIRCARIFRSPASSRCATTTSRSAWSTSRCGWPRNSAISISCRPGKAPTTCCRATRRRSGGGKGVT